MSVRDELERIVEDAIDDARFKLSADELESLTQSTVDAILARYVVVDLPDPTFPQGSKRPAWLASHPDGARKYLVAADADLVLALGVKMTPDEARELGAALLAAAHHAEAIQ